MNRYVPETYLATIGIPYSGLVAMGTDASNRRYLRLTSSDQPLLLMDSPPGLEPLAPFVCVATHLRQLGFKAPQILQYDLQNGYALIEDFGDKTFTNLLANGGDETVLYEGAAEVLALLHNHNAATEVDVPPYDMAELLREARIFTDWYLTSSQRDQGGEIIINTLAHALSDVAMRRETLVLKDFHVDNLML